MSINEFIAFDQDLINRLTTGDQAAMLREAQARGEAELAGATSLADQIEITMRLAATAALGAATSPENAKATVIWAARCARLLRGPAAEAYYLPRLAALVGGVAGILEPDARETVAAGLQTWMRKAGEAIEAVSAAERDADAHALVALAAEGVGNAGELEATARGRAVAAYRNAGQPALAGALEAR